MGEINAMKSVLYPVKGNQDRCKELVPRTEWWVFRHGDRWVRGLPHGPQTSGWRTWPGPVQAQDQVDLGGHFFQEKESAFLWGSQKGRGRLSV